MTTITTPEELDALPVDTVIEDRARWLFRKVSSTEWQCGGYGRPITSAMLAEGQPGVFGEAGGARGYGPFVVVANPDAPTPPAEGEAREALANVVDHALRPYQVSPAHRSDACESIADAALAWFAAQQPAPVDAETLGDLTDAGLVDLYWQTTNDGWPIPADVMIRYGRAVLAAHREVPRG